MILATDVYYIEDKAKCVGVLFGWDDTVAKNVIEVAVNDVEPYEPGAFYKRELPCIIQLLKQIDLKTIEAIIIDGYVYINDNEFGLGGKLWEAIGKQIPVIGVAKNPFYTAHNIIEVIRGESNKPLYVSAVGIDVKLAAENVRLMKGIYRIPDILKQLDKTTKDKT